MSSETGLSISTSRLFGAAWRRPRTQEMSRQRTISSRSLRISSKRSTRLHPEVVNALDISFLEDLYLAEPHQRDFAVPLLQPKSKARWKDVSEAYDRLSG